VNWYSIWFRIFLEGGNSGLILDCAVMYGTPRNSNMFSQLIDRNKVKDCSSNPKALPFTPLRPVGLAKKRGLEEDMCRSAWVYKRLRRFRAGIESGISWLKRCFGFVRCMWKTLRSFKSYVWASIVSPNLLTLARKRMS